MAEAVTLNGDEAKRLQPKMPEITNEFKNNMSGAESTIENLAQKCIKTKDIQDALTKYKMYINQLNNDLCNSLKDISDDLAAFLATQEGIVNDYSVGVEDALGELKGSGE